MEPARRPDNHVLAIAARTAAVACAGAVIVASLGPANWLPKLLYSNNLEHFAAFYIVALVFYAARYRTRLVRIVIDVILFASVLEAARLIAPGPRPANFDHWMADLGGILAAAAPLVAAVFRRSFVRQAAPAPPPPPG